MGAMIAGEKIKAFAALAPFIFVLRSTANKKEPTKRRTKETAKIINVFFNETKKSGSLSNRA
jgi:hypothetical protein